MLEVKKLLRDTENKQIIHFLEYLTGRNYYYWKIWIWNEEDQENGIQIKHYHSKSNIISEYHKDPIYHPL